MINILPMLVIAICFTGFLTFVILLVFADMNTQASQYTDCLNRGMQYISGNCVK